MIGTQSNPWRNLLEQWPRTLPKSGILVTEFGEQIAFVNFMVAGELAIFERERPDQLGTRKVIVGYSAIQGIKLSDPGDLGRYHILGFQAVS